MGKKAFTKPAKSAADLITFLEGRGLIVADHAYAEHCLSYLGYYRLKIYMRPFEDAGKKFRAATTFEQIVEVYNFDRRLRLHCLDAIERIEIALRAHIINVMGMHGGAHFYYEEKYFSVKSAVTDARLLGANGKHLSITHYKAAYSEPSLPAIWCLMEASTFGFISRMYADLMLAYRKQIASGFNLDETICVSWFRTLAGLRNICAHHGRLYNAEMHVDTPKQAKAYGTELAKNTRLYSRLVVLRIMLESVDPVGLSEWKQKLVELIQKRPTSISFADMGMLPVWQTHTLWV